MKKIFLKLKDHDELANFFGLTYPQLVKIIYKTDSSFKYHSFQIPKKGGGQRQIYSPAKKLKNIQNRLKDVLYEIYPTKTSAHGFAKRKSIITNAEKHLDKKYIFNLDLSDFFGSIWFERVRNLFKSSPFNFNNTIATILAQISCFNNSLPQGAPTSPILSNMIAWKLDSQLQQLARVANCTYTRYADDISFSFTCNRRRLTREIIIIHDDEWTPGHALTNIIEENGFKINYEKVRLCSKNSRMEVTGITVNEFPNVKRQYIRQLSSMLYAWREHGYDAAEKEYNEKYNKRYRASDKPKSYLFVLKGKLAFLRSVRTFRNPLFVKLATQFNNLVDDKNKFKLVEISDPEQNAIDALWVVEACYDKNGEANITQGTGFQLEDNKIITCAHVVSDKDSFFENLEVYKHSNTKNTFSIQVDKICKHRDVAICSIVLKKGETPPENCIDKPKTTIKIQDNVKLLGYPAHALGHSHYIVDSKIAKTYTASAVKKFEIDHPIREGNSGGPVIDIDSKVIGMALEGATKESGHNGCLLLSEIEEVLNDSKYDI